MSCIKLPINIKHNSNHAMISIGRKLFDEVDIPTESNNLKMQLPRHYKEKVAGQLKSMA